MGVCIRSCPLDRAPKPERLRVAVDEVFNLAAADRLIGLLEHFPVHAEIVIEFRQSAIYDPEAVTRLVNALNAGPERNVELVGFQGGPKRVRSVGHALAPH